MKIFDHASLARQSKTPSLPSSLSVHGPMNGKHSRLGLLKEDGTALKTCVVRLRDLK